tara:strand:+ start:216 stop:617 length:402 start_codon:yes stop_codon:yes gene_type:complete
VYSSEIILPSNKKFGFTFSIIFVCISLYIFLHDYYVLAILSLIIGFLFFLITLINDEILLPLNKLWMKLGFILGKIISPIILGIIFFGIFTPLSLITRIFGRDELRLKVKSTNTKWIDRYDQDKNNGSFKQQY